MGPLARLLQGHSHQAARAHKRAFPPGRRITSKATHEAPAVQRVRPGGNDPIQPPCRSGRYRAASTHSDRPGVSHDTGGVGRD
jgi:hypothetical protein